jgi:hypothetical protein
MAGGNAAATAREACAARRGAGANLSEARYLFAVRDAIALSASLAAKVPG